MSDQQNYFEALKFEPALDLHLVDRAYRQAARIHHPDKGGAPEAVCRVKSARDKISEKLSNFLMRHQRR